MAIPPMPKRSKFLTAFLVLTLVAQGVLMIMRHKTQREIAELQKERQKMIVPLPKVDPKEQVAAFLAERRTKYPILKNDAQSDSSSDAITDMTHLTADKKAQ
jgi:septation ring formation regulator EzrA